MCSHRPQPVAIVAPLALLFVSLSHHGISGKRLKAIEVISSRPTKAADDPRQPCTNVQLKPPLSNRPGNFLFNNENTSALTDINDWGTRDWSIEAQIDGKPSQTIVTRPSVRISLVSVECVQKGLCADMVTTAIDYWRFTASDLKPGTDFGVSLHFTAEPAAAGCICYMDAMMAGHSRTKLYVVIKEDFEVSVHEEFVITDDEPDIDLSEWKLAGLAGTSFTSAQAANFCRHVLAGCRGFTINRNQLEDQEALDIDDFHFKEGMSKEKLELVMGEEVTSYIVQQVAKPPYVLQYDRRNASLSFRDWCAQRYESPESKVSEEWLFL